METMHSLIAQQYTQERIAKADAERLAKQVRQSRSRTRSRRRALLFRRPVVSNAAAVPAR